MAKAKTITKWDKMLVEKTKQREEREYVLTRLGWRLVVAWAITDTGYKDQEYERLIEPIYVAINQKASERHEGVHCHVTVLKSELASRTIVPAEPGLYALIFTDEEDYDQHVLRTSRLAETNDKDIQAAIEICDRIADRARTEEKAYHAARKMFASRKQLGLRDIRDRLLKKVSWYGDLSKLEKWREDFQKEKAA